MESVPNIIGASDSIEVMAQGRPGPGAGPPGDFLAVLLQSLPDKPHEPPVPTRPKREGRFFEDDVSPDRPFAPTREAVRTESPIRPEEVSRPDELLAEAELAPESKIAGRIAFSDIPSTQPKEKGEGRAETIPTSTSLINAQERGVIAVEARIVVGELKTDISSEALRLEEAAAGERAKVAAEGDRAETATETPGSSSSGDASRGGLQPNAVPERAAPVQHLPEGPEEPDAARAFLRGDGGPPADLIEAGERSDVVEAGEAPPTNVRATVSLQQPGELVETMEILVEDSPAAVQPSSGPVAPNASLEQTAARVVVATEDAPLDEAAAEGKETPHVDEAPTPIETKPLEREVPENAREFTLRQMPDAPDEGAPEEVQPPPDEAGRNAGHVLADSRVPRPGAGHGVEPAAHESAARDVTLTSAEAEETMLRALGPRDQAPANPSTASPDAVLSAELSSGADGAGNEGKQAALRAFASSVSTPESAGAPEGEATERLDAVFKQVLSTAALPLDLRQRIELARSIGRQVIRSAVVSVKNGQTHVVLQLRPPSLGAVRMQLTTEGKAVSVRLSVENELVRGVVEQHLSQLRSVLLEEGFNLERFEVSVRSQTGSDAWVSGHAEGNGRREGRADAAERDEAHDKRASDERTDEAPLSVAAGSALVHDGTVDYLA